MQRNTRLIVIGIIVLGSLVYAFNLDNPLFWDDDDWIVANPAVHELSWSATKFLFGNDILAGINQESNYYRPVLMLSFAFNWALGGESPIGYHLVSNMLHIGAALLLYLLLRAFLRSRVAAVLAALFWLIHPLNTEAVAYISGRGDPLSVFFMLLALVIWLVGCGRWPNYQGSHLMWWKLGALGAAILAILSRETAVLFPGYLILFSMAFVYREPFVRSLKRSVVNALPFIGISSFYVVLRLTVLNFSNTLNWHRFSNVYSESVLVRTWTFVGALFDYVRLAFIPTGLHMERNVLVLLSPSTWPAPLVIGVLGLVIWQTLRAWRKGNRTWFFGVGWFFTAFIFSSGIVAPINALIYEHWMYMPLVGIAVITASYADMLYAWAKERSRGLSIILVAIAVVYGLFLSIQTIRRNIIWGDTERFYLQILDYEPTNNRVLNNIANLYADEGEPDKAEEYWTRAVEADPTHPAPYYNLGNLARDRGDDEAAENLYLLAISKQEAFHYAYRNLAAMYLRQQRFEEAQGMLVLLIQLVPQDPTNYYVLAQLYDAGERPDLALQILDVGEQYIATPEQQAAYQILRAKLQ